jgi:hypothetical protein
VHPDFDDTLAARKAAEAVTHAAPDLDDTVISSTSTVPLEPEKLHEQSWPSPSWPAALDVVPTPAPTYAFRIGFDAAPIALDGVVFVGRKPVLPRIAQAQHPRLVTVASPTAEVSKTHLELRQRGANVVITDLRSTNGSVVVIPGNPPRKMRQGESVVVTPGTFIDIGDGNLIEILAERLRYSGATE